MSCLSVCPTVYAGILVIVFGICWAPFHIDRLMWSFINTWTGHHHLVFQYVHIVSGVFFYLSSAVNPILYNLMSTRFREMFQQITCHSGLCGGNVPRLSARSTQMTLRSIVYEKPQHNGTPERITPDRQEQNVYVNPHGQHVYGNTSPD